MANTENLKIRTRVTFDGRSTGPQVGTITKRVAIPAHSGGADLVYYMVKGYGVLIPAADVTGVAA